MPDVRCEIVNHLLATYYIVTSTEPIPYRVELLRFYLADMRGLKCLTVPLIVGPLSASQVRTQEREDVDSHLNNLRRFPSKLVGL